MPHIKSVTAVVSPALAVVLSMVMLSAAGCRATSNPGTTAAQVSGAPLAHTMTPFYGWVGPANGSGVQGPTR